MRRWLPLSETILRMVVRTVPCPREAQADRLSTLFPRGRPVANRGRGEGVEEMSREVARVKAEVARCDAGPDATVVVYVAKMASVRAAELSPRDAVMLRDRGTGGPEGSDVMQSSASEGGSSSGFLSDGSGEVFMALARVYSGVLRRDCRLFALGHRYDCYSAADQDWKEGGGSDPPADLQGLKPIPPNTFGMYMCFGPSVCAVDEVPAGNIVGIVGVHDSVMKTGTLTSSWKSVPMSSITFQTKPVVRVAVEPSAHQDLAKLEAGLQQLYQYDPVVEVGVDSMGQHTLTCIGELHLEQCLKMLKDRFARWGLSVSWSVSNIRNGFAIATDVTSPLPSH